MIPPLHSLLELQSCDLSADQLRHRRATLPGRDRLRVIEASLVDLAESRAKVDDRLSGLTTIQRRLEDEIASALTKAKTQEGVLYSGAVNIPRELQALDDEVKGLRRRARSLEDEVLAVMEESEPLGEEAVEMESERADLEAEAGQTRAELAEEEAGIDSQLASLLARRREIAALIPPDLTEAYERLRAKLGGVGVARLAGNRCLGCHLVLPATEVDAIRHAPPGALVTHDECGRIMVV